MRILLRNTRNAPRTIRGVRWRDALAHNPPYFARVTSSFESNSHMRLALPRSRVVRRRQNGYIHPLMFVCLCTDRKGPWDVESALAVIGTGGPICSAVNPVNAVNGPFSSSALFALFGRRAKKPEKP
eukprot:7036614-Pyramimonas_sp.AAC.1